MLLKVATALVGLLVGGWMLFDGVYVMARGKYFGPPEPGPWRIAFVRLGIDPFRLGPLFVLFGLAWLVFLAGALNGWSWGWYGSVVIAIATLWYLPLGTLLSIIYLGLLWWGTPGAARLIP